MKKVLSLLLACVLLLGAAACSTVAPASTSTAPEATKQVESAPASQKEESKATEAPAAGTLAAATSEPVAENKYELTKDRIAVIGSGSSGGGYYAVGVVVGDLIDKYTDHVSAYAVEAGATDNVRNVDSGDYDFGFASDTVVWQAYNALDVYTHNHNLAVIGRMAGSLIQVVTTEDTGINSIADLKGKVVNMGPVGTNGYILMTQVLDCYGIKEGDYSPMFVSWAEGTDAVADKVADAAVVIAAAPTSAVESLASRRNIKMIDVDLDLVQPLLDSLPIYSTTIPAGTYTGQAEGCTTIGWKSSLFVRADEDDAFVYQVLKTLYEHEDALRAAHAFSKQWEWISEAGQNELPIPAHEAAIQFSKDNGLW